MTTRGKLRRGVFISYRRGDAAGEAGRLADHLSALLGTDSVFLDVAGITAGDDWRQRLDAALDACDTVLVVVGQRWLDLRSVARPEIRRIDGRDDMVAWEVSRGLSRGLRVIQVLVQGAKPLVEEMLPSQLLALAMRQSVNFRHETFASDVHGIAVQIRRSRRASAFSADWRASDLRSRTRVLNCGDEGTVAAITIVHGLELLLARNGTPYRLSVRYLYEKIRRSQQSENREGEIRMLPALFVTGFFGVPLETVWPYKPGNARLPPGKTWKALDAHDGFRCRGDFFRVDGLSDAVKQLAAGRPIVCSCRVEAGGSWLFGDGDVPMPAANAKLFGDAWVLLVGFDPTERRFHFMAPWGEGWGKGGFGTIEVDVARRVVEPDSLWSVELAADTIAQLWEERGMARERHVTDRRVRHRADDKRCRVPFRKSR